MIFYFTGTGNSYYVAQTLAKANNDTLISIADALKAKQFNFTLSGDETVGFVFPIYYWGLPTVVSEFLEKLQLDNYNNTFTYAVCTCGASIGNTMKIFERKLIMNNYHLDSGYSVAMPDNYVIMYDVISKEEQARILHKANEKIENIKLSIEKKEKGVFLINTGSFPVFISFALHKIYKHGRKTKKFYTTDSCIGCGKCAKICPCSTISMNNGKPMWNKECTQCLACIHRCPTKAIQYGKKTITRGRYVNPNVKL